VLADTTELGRKLLTTISLK